jgi:hypothetical protein
MASRSPTPQRVDALSQLEDWLRQQNASLGRFGHDAEHAGRDAWDQVTRAGQALVDARRRVIPNARAPSATLQPAQPRPIPAAGRPRAAQRPSSTPAAPPQPANQIGEQLRAGAGGALDVLTFGLGDRASAGVRAVVDASKGADLGDAWRRRMSAERAQDAYDAQHYRAARTVGEIAGTGAGLLALGPLDGLLAGGARIAETTPMLLREAATLSAGGAGGGVAGQALTDAQRGQLGSWGDYAGSALGGAVSALAAARGLPPGQTAAMGGETTSAAQDLLNGRRVDWGNAGRAALAGDLVAAPIGYAGRLFSDGLSMAEKGALGEALGRARTRLNGDTPIYGPKRRFYFNEEKTGPYTYLDHPTRREIKTEQKFGPKAKLRPNQRLAYNLLGDRYRIDHFLPRDIGSIVGYLPGLLAYHEVDGPRTDGRGR